MKTLIFGAGPTGSLYAARLFEAGHDITLLDRGQRLEDLRTHGVVLEDAFSGNREIHHIPVVDEFNDDDTYDLVMVVMRKNQAQKILPTLAKNRRVGTYLFLMNNAAGPDELVEALGKERVMIGLPSSGAYHQGPVTKVMPAKMAPLYVGEVDGRVGDRTRAIADFLSTMRDKKAKIRTDMDAYLVTHISMLAAHLGVYAAGLDGERFAKTRDAIILGLRAQQEAMRAQRAAGIPVRPPYFRAVHLIPEAFMEALMRPIARTTFYQTGIIGHARAARDEIAHLLDEFRQRVAPGGEPMPAFEELAAYVAEDAELMPVGRRQVPMRWKGVVALGVGLTSASALIAWRNWKKKGSFF